MDRIDRIGGRTSPPFLTAYQLNSLTAKRLSTVPRIISPIFRAFLLVVFAASLVSCVASNQQAGVDLKALVDKPIPPEVEQWLEGGEQSQLTARILDVRSQISGTTRRERAYRAVDFVWTQFRYDNWLNDKAFARTSDELFESRRLGGCADYAQAQVTLFRALGIPARMVLTANVDWMQKYKTNDLWITTGHVFIEAWLEDRWHLIDSTYRFHFTKYDMTLKSYPRNEFFCFRAKDYWSIGIRSVEDLDRIYGPIALAFRESDYRDPQYPKIDLVIKWSDKG